jgi:uncharacterized protein YndB with AHSA1/START domain
MNEDANIDVDIAQTIDAPRALVFNAFTDPDQLAHWYGPEGFSVPRDTVDVDARAGGHQRFVMVSDADPQIRSAVNLRFTEVVENELLVGVEDWDGVPGQQGSWSIHRRLEFHDERGGVRVVLREGPHPPGMADMALQAWEAMFAKLRAMLER